MSEKDKAIQLEKKIVNAWSEIEKNYYEIARMAKEFIDKQYYVELGYKTPDDWARKALGYGKRKIQFLVSIEKKLIECGVPESKKLEVGWTKMRLLSRVMTKETAGELIEKAKKMTVIEIEDDICKNEAENKKSQNKPIGYLYIPYYDNDQKEEYDEIMELAARITGSDRKDIQFLAMGQECKVEWLHKAEVIEGIRNEIFERDGWKCRCCSSRKNLSPHEIVFRSHSGIMSLENSITLCIPCHDDVTNERMKIEKIGDNQYKFFKK